MEDKVGHFQCKFFCFLLLPFLFRRAALNKPSTSGNVNFAIGQADKIFVPYVVVSGSKIHYKSKISTGFARLQLGFKSINHADLFLNDFYCVLAIFTDYLHTKF
jgi:hypothetical protein